MKISCTENSLWKWLFFGLMLGYCLYYAPFGVNETDGGFLTGLAWQVLNGKVLYQDIIYVRPPLSVWLRSLELQCLPEHFGVLGERWIFYLKVGMYSWLGATLLSSGKDRWILATFGFVVSAHCYPAMAWHTVDGILFGVLAVYLFFKPFKGLFGIMMAVFAGVSLVAAMLCKQSFYPLMLLFGVGAVLFDRRKSFYFFAGLLASIAMFIQYLYQNKLLEGFLKMTNGAASGGQAFQHGVLDYFLITPALAIPSVLLFVFGWWLWQKNASSKWLALLWAGGLLALVLSYAGVTWVRQEHTAPFAQSRALFWVAVAVICPPSLKLWRVKRMNRVKMEKTCLASVVLLSITWCATISWGYSLPMLFATPWIWAAKVVGDRLSLPFNRYVIIFRFAMLFALLLTFRVGYEFIYRDGKRAEMTEHMGDVFPKLSGIYSDKTTAERYRDLKFLAEKYAASFTVLPAFPQANYLTSTTPLLPLDWVVNRETNGDNQLIFNCLSTKMFIIFFEKNYLEKLETDPQLSVSKVIYEQSKFLEETPFFVVKQVN